MEKPGVTEGLGLRGRRQLPARSLPPWDLGFPLCAVMTGDLPSFPVAPTGKVLPRASGEGNRMSWTSRPRAKMGLGWERPPAQGDLRPGLQRWSRPPSSCHGHVGRGTREGTWGTRRQGQQEEMESSLASKSLCSWFGTTGTQGPGAAEPLPQARGSTVRPQPPPSHWHVGI